MKVVYRDVTKVTKISVIRGFWDFFKMAITILFKLSTFLHLFITCNKAPVASVGNCIEINFGIFIVYGNIAINFGGFSVEKIIP